MSSSNLHGLELICLECAGPLSEVGEDGLRCLRDGTVYSRQGGIWRFLNPEESDRVQPFLSDYHRLRRDENWGSESHEYYRSLPYLDRTGRHTEIWKIRAASFDRLGEVVLGRPPLRGRRLRVVDLGAGNGWLSWRLAEAGHLVAALDLSVDRRDGLGAARAYGEDPGFDRVQASFDEVPLADDSLDLVVFNGSVHYSRDLWETLDQAKRLLKPEGRIVIMDTPIYRWAASGEAMTRERRQAWTLLYGESFGAEPTAGFLARRQLHELGIALGIRWQIHALNLGWRWHLGPLVAVLRGHREPARFPLIVGGRL